MYEVILHYKRKKAKEKKTKQFVISAQSGIDTGPLVPKSKHKVTTSSCVPLEITVHYLSIRHIPIRIQGK